MRVLPSACVALAALNLVDMAITACLLTLFDTVAEANLLMGALWAASPALFIAVKALLSALFFFLSRRVDRCRKWMAVAILPTAAVYCVAVGWGIFVLVTVT